MYVKLKWLKGNTICNATTKIKTNMVCQLFSRERILHAKKIHSLVPTVYFVFVCFHFNVKENGSPRIESQTILPAANFSSSSFLMVDRI